MIRPIAALTRQVQQLFHDHLVGLYRWDDAKFAVRERNVNIPPEQWERNRRGRRIRPERLEGRYHAVLQVQFGVWDLSVEGPNERPPLGRIKLSDGHEATEGPLDPATWALIGKRITSHHMERDNGTEHRASSPVIWGGGNP